MLDQMLGTTTIPTTAPPRRDIYWRGRMFDERSFTHHGKMNLHLVRALIERYSAPGDLVLDPMGGTGSVFLGLLMGRRVACGDIEAQWSKLMGANLARCKQDVIGFASPGQALRWDAARLPIAARRVDLILTSPPYFDTWSDWDATSNILEDEDRHGEHGLAYGMHSRQIGNNHVYEEYLRAMRQVYAECVRVLKPGGLLALVVKDVIRKGRRVPVVADNELLALATGFTLVERFDVPTRGTRFRNVNRDRFGQHAPPHEPVLIFERAPRQAKQRLALIELPLLNDTPGWTIAEKAAAHAAARGFEFWVRSPGDDAFRPRRSSPSRAGVARRRLKARDRRELAFGMARDLVVKVGLGAGDEVAFYGSQRFGQYLCMRLETLGLEVDQVLAGMNNGQRLAYLTGSRE